MGKKLNGEKLRIIYQDNNNDGYLDLDAIAKEIQERYINLTPPTADELLDKYFDNYLGYDWRSTDIRFVKIFYKDNKFYITDDWINTQEVTIEWVKMTCELFFMEVE